MKNVHFQWETDRERLARFMKIPARRKLEWLLEMNRFNVLQSRKTRSIRKRLRNMVRSVPARHP